MTAEIDNVGAQRLALLYRKRVMMKLLDVDLGELKLVTDGQKTRDAMKLHVLPITVKVHVACS